MRIFIDDIEYPIRRNFLHRGMGKSRVVLNKKEDNVYIYIQIEGPSKPEFSKTYDGWWCVRNSHKGVKVRFEE